jgi:chromatin modification-related protein VID21
MSADPLLGLFDGSKPNNLPLVPASTLPHAPKDPRRRVADHPWTPDEDALLRNLVEKYPVNWRLVADCFNSIRYSIATDKRSPWECFDRWNSQWVGNRATPADDDGKAVPPTPTTATMTTRGVKRQAVASISSGGPSGSPAPGGESTKRRRHNRMHDTIRKAIKKRRESAANKAQGMNTSAIGFHFAQNYS